MWFAERVGFRVLEQLRSACIVRGVCLWSCLSFSASLSLPGGENLVNPETPRCPPSQYTRETQRGCFSDCQACVFSQQSYTTLPYRRDKERKKDRKKERERERS